MSACLPEIRDATAADAGALTALFLAARAAAMPYLPALHGEVATRAWMERVVLAEQRVIVAETGRQPAGFAAFAPGLVHHLYVAPARQNGGVGRRLLAAAQAANPDGLRLFVFQRNLRARQFYARAGFRAIALRDGSDNEEREPDALYEWAPSRMS